MASPTMNSGSQSKSEQFFVLVFIHSVVCRFVNEHWTSRTMWCRAWKMKVFTASAVTTQRVESYHHTLQTFVLFFLKINVQQIFPRWVDGFAPVGDLIRDLLELDRDHGAERGRNRTSGVVLHTKIGIVLKVCNVSSFPLSNIYLYSVLPR